MQWRVDNRRDRSAVKQHGGETCSGNVVGDEHHDAGTVERGNDNAERDHWNIEHLGVSSSIDDACFTNDARVKYDHGVELRLDIVGANDDGAGGLGATAARALAEHGSRIVGYTNHRSRFGLRCDEGRLCDRVQSSGLDGLSTLRRWRKHRWFFTGVRMGVIESSGVCQRSHDPIRCRWVVHHNFVGACER